MACFDDLNSDLMFEIFDYLSFDEIWNAFYGLRQCINKWIQMYPSSIALLNEIDIDKIKNGLFLCRSLELSNFDSEKIQLVYSCLNFEAIHAIEFHYITSDILTLIFKNLPLQQLEYIVIHSWEFSNDPDSTHMDDEIFSLITKKCHTQLRYLNISVRRIIQDINQSLSFYFPSLKYVFFKNIRINEMLMLLQHAPNISYFKTGLTATNNNCCAYNFTHSKLTNLNLTIKGYCDFEKLSQLFSVCPNLMNLVLQIWITMTNREMTKPMAWQLLIEQYLVYLQCLRLNFYRYTPAPDWDIRDYEIEESFNSFEFWDQRKLDFNMTVR